MVGLFFFPSSIQSREQVVWEEQADFDSASYEYKETGQKKLQGISNRNCIVTYQLHNKPKKVVAGWFHLAGLFHKQNCISNKKFKYI